MNLSLTRKRSLFSELKNDTYFRTFALIAGVIISTFGLFPLVGYIWHKYSLPLDTSVQLGDVNVGYFDFMFNGFVICTIAALTLGAIYLIYHGITITVGYLKAMNRSTYLPLTKEEIEANGLTSMKEYVAYVYNQIVYFAGTYDNRSIYN